MLGKGSIGYLSVWVLTSGWSFVLHALCLLCLDGCLRYPLQLPQASWHKWMLIIRTSSYLFSETLFFFFLSLLHAVVLCVYPVLLKHAADELGFSLLCSVSPESQHCIGSLRDAMKTLTDPSSTEILDIFSSALHVSKECGVRGEPKVSK